MKKSKLVADFDYDFDLWGVITPLKEYKLAWHINRVFGIQLIKDDDIDLDFVSKNNLVISNYMYETEYSMFRLLKNKSVEGQGSQAFILPELQRFDYLIMINGFDNTFSDEEFKSEIMKISQIQYLQKFDLANIKSKENLIF